MSAQDDLVHKVIDVGKKYYRAAEFKKACSMFTKAIVLNESFSESQLENTRLQYGLAKRPNHDDTRVWHPLLCQALDFRSLCYEKLEKYNESFRDGKAMINYEPYNMKGYIRCGKLYESSLNKPQRALKYYDLGLRKAEIGESSFKIKPNQKLIHYLQQRVQTLKPIVEPVTFVPASQITSFKTRQTLKRKNEELVDVEKTPVSKSQKQQEQRQLIDLREFDILNALPVEIMNQIMAHLTCKDVLNCMRLNKLWSQYIFFYPAPLLQNVYLRDLTDLKGFGIFLENCNKFRDQVYIEKIHFNPSGLLESKMLISTSMSSQAIRDYNTKNRHKDSLEQHLSLKHLTIANLVYKKSKIPLVKLPTCPALKELALFGMHVSADYFEDLYKKVPQIQSLKLEKLMNFSLFSFLEVFCHNKMQFRLKKLTIREDKLILMPQLSINQEQRMILAENFSDLRELDLYSSSITFPNLYKLIEQCFKLEYLNIGNCPNVIFDNARQDIITQIFDQLRNATNLRVLLLPQLIGINSIIFETIIIKHISMLPDLQMLDISFNEEITGVNLWSLLRTLNNQNLALLCNGCPKIGPGTVLQIQNNKPTPLVKKIIYEYTLQQWTRNVLKNYYN
ncbi:hypothetical protein ACO0QE_000093 [Hanseniaspora vineae]